MPTFSWIFKYQPIVSELLTQPSRYKKSRKQFPSRRKRSPTLEPGIYLDYIFILLHLLIEPRKICYLVRTLFCCEEAFWALPTLSYVLSLYKICFTLLLVPLLYGYCCPLYFWGVLLLEGVGEMGRNNVIQLLMFINN